MKHKTAELTGALLDAAVAMAKGWPPYPDKTYRGWLKDGILLPSDEWEPSTNWYDGGPIIERELIELRWYRGIGQLMWKANSATGPTPLIAAMRAYVASKLGDEVELP